MMQNHSTTMGTMETNGWQGKKRTFAKEVNRLLLQGGIQASQHRPGTNAEINLPTTHPSRNPKAKVRQSPSRASNPAINLFLCRKQIHRHHFKCRLHGKLIERVLLCLFDVVMSFRNIRDLQMNLPLVIVNNRD